MEITRKALEDLTMVNNKVLLKAAHDTGKIKFLNTELILMSGSTDNNATVIYEVVKLPKEIVQTPVKQGEVLEWIPEMELVVGDKVWVNRMKIQNTQHLRCEGEDFVLLPYQYIYLTVRPWNPEDDRCAIIINPDCLPQKLDPKRIMDEFKQTGRLLYEIGPEPAFKIENSRHKNVTLPPNCFERLERVGSYYRISFFKVVMLNGWILFQDVPAPVQSEFAIKDDIMPFCGVVKFTGSLNKSYTYYKWPEANYIHPGDLIHFKIKHRRALEYDLHKEFADKGRYYLAQRREILGKIINRDI